MLSFDRDDGFSSSPLSTTMNQTVTDGAAPFLPEEIMNNILKRLPAKSLVRFQCVCKHWKNLFKTSSFITDHLRLSRPHNPSLLFFQNYGSNSLQLRLLDCDMQVRDVPKAPPFDSLPFKLVSIIGSSNGLLCVTIHENESVISPSSLLLWNPSTRDVREVPNSRTIDSCVLGFGFSSSLNDYKIVVIDGMDCEVEVYSLKTDSWKEIEYVNLLDDVFISPNTVVSFDGAIFWNGQKPGNKRKVGVIVSFDIVMEAFSLIPLPRVHSNSFINLTVYKDKLAILSSGAGGSSNINLWVREEDIGSSRERWSWTKKFTSGPCPWTLNGGGTIWRNEIVMSGTETCGKLWKKKPESGLCMLNLTTNEFKVVVVPKHGSYQFLNHVESLLPVVNFPSIEEP
ncbi:F-box/LRR-repeat/kelch-repeat protein At2g27520-like [Neltuma alba]|uniref:F-box/LRR-repeat/kelch-repeat protein At2g27520-like n=1 Tax=Neltuma alba TaxID=207710 RepID=UPI0010A53E75|nr:F-box/LRR-repeat/kelch-repeat protein At2g27520-like [Prosopis alba]